MLGERRPDWNYALSLLSSVALTFSLGAAVPDKVVVLTFDDSIKSHYSVVGPMLKQYGFGATFFVTEGFEFGTDKEKYMTWEEIASLHRDGFEIGNHTRDHMGLTEGNLPRLTEQVEAINRRCQEYGIPRPTSFAYPGNAISDGAIEALARLGFTFARRGGAPEHPYELGRGFAYEPGLDHPLLIPSAGDSRPHWRLEDFVTAVEQAKFGRISVMQFHGVPDRAHAWVHTPKERFVEYMDYLAANQFKVIALRDLKHYVDPTLVPNRHHEVIEDRQRSLRRGQSRDSFRQPRSSDEQAYWLRTMVEEHGYSSWEVRAATGLSVEVISQESSRLGLSKGRTRSFSGLPLTLRPYPGGRHPRIGFLDGAMRPQRETKFSLFAPWKDGGYAVVDVPEAIWEGTGEDRHLLYLAHTHIDTKWSEEGIELEPLEWEREGDSVLRIERVLPNQVSFGARIQSGPSMVEMELWLKNGTETTLTGLNLQNCVMLRELRGFADRDNRNKVYSIPYAACRNEEGNRWVITGWQGCRRPWGNRHCPCLHADPRFPDCPPGVTVRLRGMVSFYEGTEIKAELRRLDPLWRGEF